MSLFKNPFAKTPHKINSYSDFWTWFQANERQFFQIVKTGGNMEMDFFAKLSPKLAEMREGYYFLSGMCDTNTAELIITADGIIKNIVFVEELIEAAPEMVNWKFTAHKPALDIKDVNINLGGYLFNGDNLAFYPTEDRNYPDEIEITVVDTDLNEKNRKDITNGIYIFLDNFLGELNFATTIDNLNVEGSEPGGKELIPIHKLKDYLSWRQKEFIGKYHGVRRHTENDRYATFEATLENGNRLVAMINTDLLDWDRKASHPWILKVEIKYFASDNDGMPDDISYKLMNEIEEEIDVGLKDFEGYLNVGRETSGGAREIYYACNDFRKSSKVASVVIEKYSDKFEIDYNIYKDKYWRTFKKFVVR